MLIILLYESYVNKTLSALPYVSQNFYFTQSSVSENPLVLIYSKAPVTPLTCPTLHPIVHRRERCPGVVWNAEYHNTILPQRGLT